MHGARRVAAVLALLLGSEACRAADRTPHRGTVFRRPGEIEFAAKINARSFDRGGMMPGYHAVVWKKGRMAHAALLQADVTDVEILDALESLGARAGATLPMDAWEARRDPRNDAPDRRVSGDGIEILLRLPGRRALVPLVDVLEDPGGRGLDMRLAGNRANVPKWKSGCAVCLFSCPGSKVGNARYTVREWEKKVTRFRSRKGVLPADGTNVGVVMRRARPAAPPPSR
ncbi:MAG TPA: YdjY domain-containing protein [Thermoanaerobaculia bacterium]|nr:YdjY domain-containing protein [Thermoanaerobaculia bacterium]